MTAQQEADDALAADQARRRQLIWGQGSTGVLIERDPQVLGRFRMTMSTDFGSTVGVFSRADLGSIGARIAELTGFPQS